jgi:hypothetical protein
MRAEYDFSQSLPNPYTKSLKTQTVIRREAEAVDELKVLEGQAELPDRASRDEISPDFPQS